LWVRMRWKRRFREGAVRRILAMVAVLAAWSFLVPVSEALPKFKKDKGPQVSGVYDDYIKQVREMNLPEPNTTGSLWVDSSALAHMAGDYKARQPGDLVTIHLVDNFTAGTNGENKQSRQFSLLSAVSALFGSLGANNRMQNLANANSSHSLDGKGQSSMSSNVTLNLAAQVMETLPNGVLVVQAARDITLGNDRQTVFVRGLVRPGDLAPDNSVTSTLVSDLQVEIKGKGAVADASRQPNFIVNALVKLLSF
jgi:flagellar L-ring protein FlgH